MAVAALVVVLPSAALWGTPSSAMFDLADPTSVASEAPPALADAADATSILPAQDASGSSLLGSEAVPALRTEPWQSPFPLLFVLAVVVALWSVLPVRLPRRWRERIGRPSDAEVHAACGVRAPPSLL